MLTVDVFFLADNSLIVMKRDHIMTQNEQIEKKMENLEQTFPE